MTPKAYMIYGAAVGVFITMLEILPAHPQVGMLAFAAGMLFGKGYGIWEERGRRAALKDQRHGE